MRNDTHQDPLRALLTEHWSPEATNAESFSHGLAKKQRAARRRRSAVAAGSFLAVAAGVAFAVLTQRTPSDTTTAASAWLAHTSASASPPLPLPDDYAAIGRLYLQGGGEKR